jgi:RNA polymerase sigma-70 factor (ECF subfamily)
LTTSLVLYIKEEIEKLMIVNEDLVITMKKGNDQSFSSCYKLLSPLIYSIIFRICGRSAIAEEIMQDTFIQAFTNLSQLKDNKHFTPWIKQIAFNKTMTHLNKVKNEVSATDDHLESLKFDDFDGTVIHENQLAFLLGHLSAEAKLVVWLFIVEGYSHKEIAVLTNKTQSYSKSIVSRNLEKLRNIEKGENNAL